MKESAQAALSYARSCAYKFKLSDDFTEKKDIHIHVPAGATPKDGPSAGITMVTALISGLTNKPVANDIAMTGEITLRGRVLPVGGIKEKILAAVSAGVKKVIIPAQNKKDLEEIPRELRRKIKVTTVEHIDDIWPIVQLNGQSRKKRMGK
jgi:ATP-dependent Lon protease